jgi:hypothetical protein
MREKIRSITKHGRYIMKKGIVLFLSTTVGILFAMGVFATSPVESLPLAQSNIQPTSSGISSIGLLGLALISLRLFFTKKQPTQPT